MEGICEVWYVAIKEFFGVLWMSFVEVGVGMDGICGVVWKMLRRVPHYGGNLWEIGMLL